MSTKTLLLTLPDSLAKELEGLHEDSLIELLQKGLQEVKIDRALDLYAQARLSFEAAAEKAGLSRSELSRRAYARGLIPPFSHKTLKEELG